jgi:HAMP domain-containing protein
MTLSYVLVTAGAVVAVEAVGIGLLASSSDRPDLAIVAQATATSQADQLRTMWNKAGQGFALQSFPANATAQPSRPGEAVGDGHGGVRLGRSALPWTPGDTPTTAAVLVAPDGRVLASSFPAEYPTGSVADLPYRPAHQLYPSGRTQGSAAIAWGAAALVVAGRNAQPVQGDTVKTPASKDETPSPGPGDTSARQFVGSVFVQIPASANLGTRLPHIRTWLWVGLLVLPLVLLLGTLFGLLTTRALIRRLRRLAAISQQFAAGKLDERVPVDGHDEITSLERSLNKMASQLQHSITVERTRAEGNARHAERGRIARELHDSVSQDLFSLSLLASGLRRALPKGAANERELEAMESTANAAMQEMSPGPDPRLPWHGRSTRCLPTAR